jgi:amidase
MPRFLSARRRVRKSAAYKFALATVLGAGLLASAIPASARQVDVDQATIAEINAAFSAGTLTAEKLTEMFLARIAAYDRAGPQLHAVITLNPKALEQARALDAERKAKGPRSPLHGIPVVLKDNYDTFDMPTTGGSVILEGSVPPDDAYMVKRLREAGAIILAKVNLGEFAGGTQSSLGGQSLNPHDLSRTPGGSSGGTGVAIAAGYAPLGFGSDTGGSIRGPSNVNGIVGLKPTHGLLSRDGIIPLALSLDTGGPMARSVYDVAVSLGTMTGVDPADEATKKSIGKFEKDYTKFLKADALKGARIGLVRDFSGADPDVDWIVEASVAAMKRAGATVIDVRYPKWFVDTANGLIGVVVPPEFKVQIADYLKTLGPKYPKTLAELVARNDEYLSLGKDGAGPNVTRWKSLKERDLAAPPLTDPGYVALRDYFMPMTRALVEGIMARDKLDALVYPTSIRRPARIVDAMSAPPTSAPGPTAIANLSGFPDLIVPAGFTTDDLPVTISFMGPAFSEPKLLALGYSFEQATRAIRRPVNVPALEGLTIEIPDDLANAK